MFIYFVFTPLTRVFLFDMSARNVNDLEIAALCQVNYWFILPPA